MFALACPHCSKPIEDDPHCEECGLDASLLVQIRRSAEALAQKAAERAAFGEWQNAYEAAAESLRLARSDNDLAAFVLLIAALAGAQGSVSSIPRPRADALPSTLPPFVDEALSVAERLRTAPSISEVEELLHELDPQHPFLPPPLPAPVELPKPRPLWPAWAVAASVALLAGTVMGWYATRQPAQKRTTEKRQLTTPPVIPAAPPRPSAPKPWAMAMDDAEIQNSFSTDAWRHGLQASKNGDYERARKFLELAIQGPRTSWYWEDALFYLGKTYHRLGRLGDAAAAYERLAREAPDSQYVPEARRFLARIARGEGVDR